MFLPAQQWAGQGGLKFIGVVVLPTSRHSGSIAGVLSCTPQGHSRFKVGLRGHTRWFKRVVMGRFNGVFKCLFFSCWSVMDLHVSLSLHFLNSNLVIFSIEINYVLLLRVLVIGG